MQHRFTTSQWVPCPPGLVFAFFANPLNLPPLMPEWQKARIEDLVVVAPPAYPAVSTGAARFHSIIAGKGSTLLISFQPLPFLPIRLSWRAVITSFTWNSHFCDEQQSGPFAKWRHCHHVQKETRIGVPGTLVTDEVVYELKMGSAGELAHRLYFARQIEKLFSHRQRQLQAILDFPIHSQP